MQGDVRVHIYSDIDAERARQDEKWGVDRHLNPLLWLAILAEEFGEVAKDTLENCPNLREELVQVAAVAVAWVEDIDTHKE